MPKGEVLTFAALRVEQRKDTPLYIFGVNGRTIPQFAAVSFAARSSEGVLAGYQRERVASHISQIRSYLSTEEALLPNAVVVAFNGSVKFLPTGGAVLSRWGTPGRLTIPLPGPREKKPGLIVDGQQRVSALAQLPPSRQFPVVVISFSSDSIELQRQQFVLVNKTRPLPRDLLNELLPSVDSNIPMSWQKRRIASAVVQEVRFDKASPFYGRVRGLGTVGEGCNISMSALISVIETSIRRGGALAENSEGAVADVEAMAEIVNVFYSGVKKVWPSAWDQTPWTSRLVHGVGITALGRLMDVVMSEVDASRPRAVSSVERRLRKIESKCAWTAGSWGDPLNCPWNGLQNTSQDKRRLAEYLLESYRRARSAGISYQ